VAGDRRAALKHIQTFLKKRGGAPLDLLEWDYLGPLQGYFRERAHTMILAYLLNPRYSGPYAKRFLLALLRRARKSDVHETVRQQVSDAVAAVKMNGVRIEVDQEEPLSEERRKPDLILTITNHKAQLRILVENKVWTAESDNQTPDYFRAASGTQGKRRTGYRCSRCTKQQREPRQPMCAPGENVIGLFLDFKGKKPLCPRFAPQHYAHLKEAMDQAAFPARNSTLGRIARDYGNSLRIMTESLSEPLKWQDVAQLTPRANECALSLTQLSSLDRTVPGLRRHSREIE
jgi:hypothetical protein